MDVTALGEWTDGLDAMIEVVGASLPESYPSSCTLDKSARDRACGLDFDEEARAN